MNKISGAVKNRKSFRFRKSRDGKKFRVSKRIKHQSKETSIAIIKKLSARPYYLIGLLMKFKIYKYSTQVKMICLVFPFLVLLFLDNFILALIVACIDIFVCALLFTFATVDRNESTINGKFEYAEYKRIKAKKDTIAIVGSMLFMICSVVISHYFLGYHINNLFGI